MPSPGANSALRRPEGVFVLGTSLYVADTDQHRVLQYGLSGGDGTVVAGGNGVGSDLNQLSSPAQLFVDDSEQESGSAVVHIYVVDTDNHRVMKIREDTGDATEVAGGCLESPNYIVPCIQGGVHDPPRPWPDNMEELNPSSDNPPIYHFWGPSGLHVDVSTMDITVADSLNHRPGLGSSPLTTQLAKRFRSEAQGQHPGQKERSRRDAAPAGTSSTKRKWPGNKHEFHEIGVQYGLSKLVDKCIELIVTDDHILESEDFNGLSQAAMIELAKHDAWNLHEDSIYDIFMRWATVNSQNEEEKRQLSEPLMEQLRYPHMSISKLKKMWKSPADTVPADLVVEALFVKLEAPAG
ncbi:unnamed protein product [Effrenium voratum]|uniref:BACK domain-containing protein n=1 Tax=Effrenium voratum TaxID=2562239 RepID=A0AA36IDI2_9DINO|nr:unnamed protein product [Effrenium voratum]